MRKLILFSAVCFVSSLAAASLGCTNPNDTKTEKTVIFSEQAGFDTVGVSAPVIEFSYESVKDVTVSKFEAHGCLMPITFNLPRVESAESFDGFATTPVTRKLNKRDTGHEITNRLDIPIPVGWLSLFSRLS